MATITIDSDTTWVEDKDYSGDDIIITNNATLTIDSHNKIGSPDTQIRIRCRNLTVDAGAKISGDGKGYLGHAQTDGDGPGGGKAEYHEGGGGGYGAAGGDGEFGAGGSSYGYLWAASQQGSAGGGSTQKDAGQKAGNGGAAIRISAANKITVNGIISSNGQNPNSNSYEGLYPGAGSGGGIQLFALEIAGSGTIEANGGDAGRDGGGGAGGRIAIYIRKDISSITYDTSGGTGYSNGGDGTIYFGSHCDLPSYYFIENSSGFSPINFRYYKCTNWTKDESHGGDVRWTEEVTPNDIFTDVTHKEREEGDVDYRKIFFANTTFVPISGVKGYISQFTPALNDEISICASGTNNDTVAEASGYTFVQPSSLSDPDAIDWGTLQPGEYKPLWIKRVVQPAAGDGYHNNNFKIKVVKVG